MSNSNMLSSYVVFQIGIASIENEYYWIDIISSNFSPTPEESLAECNNRWRTLGLSEPLKDGDMIRIKRGSKRGLYKLYEGILLKQ